MKFYNRENELVELATMYESGKSSSMSRILFILISLPFSLLGEIHKAK